MKPRLIAVLALALVTSGCAATVAPLAFKAASTSEPVSETNYVLNEPRTVVVGEAIVRVKDYVLVRQMMPAMRASTSGSFQMGMSSGQIVGGSEYPLVGERLIDGTPHRIVEINLVGFQVRPDGTVLNKGLVRGAYNEWIPVIPAMNLVPNDLRFEPVTRVDENSIAAGENFEIVFTGRDAGAMRFQYREYTSQDMARPAFSQELSYPATARTIRFRGMAIEVLELGEDSITYKVTAREKRPAA